MTDHVEYSPDAVRELTGLPSEIVIIPLAGHIRGHAGVAVDTGKGWLLAAGDSYYHPGVLDPVHPWQPLGTALFEKKVQTLPAARIENQQRLRELARDHGDEVTVFSARSSIEFHAVEQIDM